MNKRSKIDDKEKILINILEEEKYIYIKKSEIDGNKERIGLNYKIETE